MRRRLTRQASPGQCSSVARQPGSGSPAILPGASYLLTYAARSSRTRPSATEGGVISQIQISDGESHAARSALCHGDQTGQSTLVHSGDLEKSSLCRGENKLATIVGSWRRDHHLASGPLPPDKNQPVGMHFTPVSSMKGVGSPPTTHNSTGRWLGVAQTDYQIPNIFPCPNPPGLIALSSWPLTLAGRLPAAVNSERAEQPL